MGIIHAEPSPLTRKTVKIKAEADKIGGQSAFAAAHGVTRAYVSAVLQGHRPPSRRLCKALGIREAGMRWVKE